MRSCDSLTMLSTERYWPEWKLEAMPLASHLGSCATAMHRHTSCARHDITWLCLCLCEVTQLLTSCDSGCRRATIYNPATKSSASSVSDNKNTMQSRPVVSFADLPFELESQILCAALPNPESEQPYDGQDGLYRWYLQHVDLTYQARAKHDIVVLPLSLRGLVCHTSCDTCATALGAQNQQYTGGSWMEDSMPQPETRDVNTRITDSSTNCFW